MCREWPIPSRSCCDGSDEDGRVDEGAPCSARGCRATCPKTWPLSRSWSSSWWCCRCRCYRCRSPWWSRCCYWAWVIHTWGWAAKWGPPDRPRRRCCSQPRTGRPLVVSRASCRPFSARWGSHGLATRRDSPWHLPWPTDETPIQGRTGWASAGPVDPWCWSLDAGATCASATSSSTWPRYRTARNDTPDRSCAYLPGECAMCGRIDRSYRISGRGVDLWRGPASCPSRGGPLKKEDKQKGDEGEFPQVKVPLSFFRGACGGRCWRRKSWTGQTTWEE